MPSLSVLICVHSNNRFNDSLLMEALGSLKNQSYSDFDTVIVLDECWENTKEEILKNNSIERLTILEKPKKEGLALAKNYGLSFINTDFVAFLDADDLYEPKKLEIQMEYMKLNEIDFLGTHTWCVYSTDRKTKFPSCFFEHSFNTHDDILNALPFENVLTHGSMMIRMQSLKELDYYKNIKGMEDYDLWKRAANAGYKFFQIPERLYVYSLGTSVER